jgi:gamma-butyrobetaine dioxygenase
VPGIQILHCLENATSGGLSTLSDSLAAAALLRRHDPDGFALLAEIPVRYRFRDDDTELVALRPVIETDGEERMTGVHYSPRLDELPLIEEEELRLYQAARRKLGRLLADPRLQARFALAPGELLMFDNNRILHGRTAFDPAEGRRRLIGCYLDRDGPRSHYRVLGRRLAERRTA